MNLAELTSPELIFTNLAADDRRSLLRAVSFRLAENHALGDPERLYRDLTEREELASTSIGHGVAIPHCKRKRLSQVLLAIFKTERAIDFGAEDGGLVRLFFVVISPTKQPAAHLHCLAAIAKRVQNGPFLEQMMALENPAELLSLLQDSSS